MKKLLLNIKCAKPCFILLFIFNASFYTFCSAQRWAAMDIGLYLNTGDSSGVYAIQEYNNALYAGGSFAKAGNLFLPSKIAQWNGVVWDSVARGANEIVFALQVYNGALIAGGAWNFPQCSQWNGVTWSTLGPDTSFFYNKKDTDFYYGIFALTNYNGNLIAGGEFDSIPGMHANNIAYWNGTNWNTLGSGLTLKYAPLHYANVYALTVYNGNLYAGGTFDSAGGVSAKNIAMWNGTNWTNVGSGVNNGVGALYVYNGELYAGGIFDSAGGQKANNIAKWNGSTWSTVGSGVLPLDNGNGFIGVFALTSYGPDLCVGGQFDTAGGIPANNIALWNGSTWSALGTGVNGYIEALCTYNGALIAGGSFDTAGGVPVSNIAEWIRPLGINNLVTGTGQVYVYPNPSNGVFTIQSSVVSGQLSVEVYNVLGAKVLTNTLRSIQGNNLINLCTQPNGVYFYRVVDENSNLIGEGKLVIER